MKLLLRWMLASVALLITVHIVPGLEPTGSPLSVFGATLALALLNVLAMPFLLLINLITFPLSCLTLGLWTFLLVLLVNVMVFQFVGALGWGFRVDGFLSAALGALVMSVLTTVLTGLFHAGRRAP
ncbi:MAG TPA: phage holin family protein [Armatimonadota bacterium]|nr:phage holin family protein [Armatimonadota bacterium]